MRLAGLERLASVRRRFCLPAHKTHPRVEADGADQQQELCMLALHAASLPCFAHSVQRHRETNSASSSAEKPPFTTDDYAPAVSPRLRTRQGSPLQLCAREPSLTRGRARRAKAEARWPAETSGAAAGRTFSKSALLERATAPRRAAAGGACGIQRATLRRRRMKLLAALLFGAASALQPAQVKPAAVDRRAAMKFTFPAAVAAALAPAAALAAKPPQLQSMQPPRREKSGQIKTGNAGSILKHQEARRHGFPKKKKKINDRTSPAAAACYQKARRRRRRPAPHPNPAGLPSFPKAPGAAVRLNRGPMLRDPGLPWSSSRSFVSACSSTERRVGHVRAARAQLRRLCRARVRRSRPRRRGPSARPPRGPRARGAAPRGGNRCDDRRARRDGELAGDHHGGNALLPLCDGRALRRHQRRREQHKGAEHEARRELRTDATRGGDAAGETDRDARGGRRRPLRGNGAQLRGPRAHRRVVRGARVAEPAGHRTQRQGAAGQRGVQAMRQRGVQRPSDEPGGRVSAAANRVVGVSAAVLA